MRFPHLKGLHSDAGDERLGTHGPLGADAACAGSPGGRLNSVVIFEN